MASTDTLLTLEADEEAVESFLAEHRGLLLREVDNPSVYWLVLRPMSDPDETFYTRVVWSTYPDSAPSVQFADGIGGDTHVNRAWPIVPGYRLGSFDICKPFTAEGFALHSEWQQTAHGWQSSGNPFLFVAQMLQNDLNLNYSGRNA